MSAEKSRMILWSGIGGLLIMGLAFTFWPRPVLVELLEVKTGPLKVAVSEEAKTRVHDIYVLSAPVTGYLRRIDAEVGDSVEVSKTKIAEIEPIDPTFLDTRSEAQAQAAVQAALAAEALAQAEVKQAEAELDFALQEFKRMRDLQRKNSVSIRELDNAERAYKSRRASLATAQAGLQMREFEHERAKAQLVSPATTQHNHGHCECLTISAPVSGKILKVINKSEGVINAGTPLVEIGDPRDLEIVVELLSFDAVSVEPGQRVIVKNWGGEKPLEGRVIQIEPIGFTKVSALGIEEQRVNVIVAFQSEFEKWARLGHGYQLDVDIILWEGNDVLTVPITSLFRQGEKWALYVANGGTVEKRIVEVGNKNTFDVEIVSGLKIGELIIPHPNDQIADGVEVEPLQSITAI